MGPGKIPTIAAVALITVVLTLSAVAVVYQRIEGKVDEVKERVAQWNAGSAKIWECIEKNEKDIKSQKDELSRAVEAINTQFERDEESIKEAIAIIDRNLILFTQRLDELENEKVARLSVQLGNQEEQIALLQKKYTLALLLIQELANKEVVFWKKPIAKDISAKIDSLLNQK